MCKIQACKLGKSICSCGCAGLLMLLFPFVPETPYWLVQQGDVAAADTVLHKMARVNGVTLPEVAQLLGVKWHDIK